jgi:hypothetical protein
MNFASVNIASRSHLFVSEIWSGSSRKWFFWQHWTNVTTCFLCKISQNLRARKFLIKYHLFSFYIVPKYLIFNIPKSMDLFFFLDWGL